MKTSATALITSCLVALALVTQGCSKKEAPPPAEQATAPAPTAPATPAAPATAPAAPAAAPAAPAAATDAVKSMMDNTAKAAESTTKAAEAAATQMKEAAAPKAPEHTTAAPEALQSSLASAQGEATKATEDSAAGLAATASSLQQQAGELFARYSGELSTLKSGALAVKSYVDKNPGVLPESAKATYQQFNAMVPQLESLVGALKDYKSADLTTLVPKLQSDFSKAKSLYSEVRALLPEDL